MHQKNRPMKTFQLLNKIIDANPKIISPKEKEIMLIIARHEYSIDPKYKTIEMPYKLFSDHLGRGRDHVRKAIKGLLDKKYIIKIQEQTNKVGAVYIINKDFIKSCPTWSSDVAKINPQESGVEQISTQESRVLQKSTQTQSRVLQKSTQTQSRVLQKSTNIEIREEIEEETGHIWPAASAAKPKNAGDVTDRSIAKKALSERVAKENTKNDKICALDKKSAQNEFKAIIDRLNSYGIFNYNLDHHLNNFVKRYSLSKLDEFTRWLSTKIIEKNTKRFLGLIYNTIALKDDSLYKEFLSSSNNKNEEDWTDRIRKNYKT
jgi:hypothetical protein